jgi:hypothetical protein
MRRERNALDKYSEIEFRASVVRLILNGKAEKALGQLAEHYNADLPRIRVGLPNRHRKNTLGCYTAKNQTISVLNSDMLKEPAVVLHEFYHHLRTSIDKKHRGTENYACKFAMEFIEAYVSFSTAQESPCVKSARERNEA